VELDSNTVVDMPDGFPSSAQKRGDEYVVTLRFPRFNVTVFYDPTVDSTNEAASHDITDAAVTLLASILPLSVALLLAVKFALWL